MKDLIITKTTGINTTTWFCGCEIYYWSGGGGKKEFDCKDYNSEHEKYFDKERLADVYVCHKQHCLVVDTYREL